MSGFDREVNLRAACEWNSKNPRRVCKLRKAAYGLDDDPVAVHQPLRKYPVGAVDLPSSVGLRFEVSSFDPRMYLIFGKSGKAFGVITTHIDDILGRGEPDLLRRARGFPEKHSGKLRAQGGSFVDVGMVLAQEKDFSATLTQEDFTTNLKLLPTSPAFWAGRKNPPRMDYAKLRRCKLGDLRWVATEARPDICACLVRIVSRTNSLCGSDVYRINELVREAKDWQQAPVLKYASSSHPWKTLGWSDRVRKDLRKTGERVTVIPRLLRGGRMLLTGTSRRKGSADSVT